MFTYILEKLGCKIKPDPKLVKLIQNGATLIDVRTEREFTKGSVQGAINIPLSNLKNESIKLENFESIIVFCRSGQRSSQARRILLQEGLSKVTNGGTLKMIRMIKDQIVRVV